MYAAIRLLFKCEHCGRCCKEFTREHNAADVVKIQEYTKETREEIEAKLNKQQCGYLVDNLCSIHFAKPGVCKWWPGPIDQKCPAYKKLLDKYCQEGSIAKICNSPELSELYIKCILHSDVEAAKAVLRGLGIEE